ncbi:hypothetical protein EGW08_005135 [Elysia chlorotica]|uniref:Uncharacterized protein n=1 Tax=Elysia chlorotica TaxID=188477 RepID=A0A433U043_ELYCH|nr:hypothetical protein EGW08_005135 [Elysia chlorotica]
MAVLLGLKFSPSGEYRPGAWPGLWFPPQSCQEHLSNMIYTRASTSLVAPAASKSKGDGKSSSKSSKRRPLRETKTPALPSRDKGRESCGQMPVSKPPDSSTDNMTAIKVQLQQLMCILPVVEEIKLAYDVYNEQANTADRHPDSEEGEVDEEADTFTPQPASGLDYFMTVQVGDPRRQPIEKQLFYAQDMLFSSELPEKIKDLGETFKVSQRVNKRFHPYKNEYNKKPFPFLGQRHSSWKKGRGARWGNPNYRQDRYLGQAPRQNPGKKNQPKRN